jgi:hypothetical protein
LELDAVPLLVLAGLFPPAEVRLVGVEDEVGGGLGIGMVNALDAEVGAAVDGGAVGEVPGQDDHTAGGPEAAPIVIGSPALAVDGDGIELFGAALLEALFGGGEELLGEPALT